VTGGPGRLAQGTRTPDARSEFNDVKRLGTAAATTSGAPGSRSALGGSNTASAEQMVAVFCHSWRVVRSGGVPTRCPRVDPQLSAYRAVRSREAPAMRCRSSAGVRTSTVAPQLRTHGVISRRPPTSNVRSTVPSAFSSSR
jgi:hypothetical protein